MQEVGHIERLLDFKELKGVSFPEGTWTIQLIFNGESGAAICNECARLPAVLATQIVHYAIIVNINTLV